MLAKPFRISVSTGICLASLALATTAAAQVPVDSTITPKQSGFALQTSLVASTSLFDDDLPGFSFANVEGGLTFGYKFNRVVFGVGFDFTDLSSTRTSDIYDPNTGQVTGTEEVTSSTYTFVVYPELQVALAQSADKRAELLGNFSIGVGSWGTRLSNDDTPFSGDNTNIRVRWRVGPAVRYWVHPQIAMSLATGITGNHMIVDGPTDTADRSTGITTLSTQIGLMGVF